MGKDKGRSQHSIGGEGSGCIVKGGDNNNELIIENKITAEKFLNNYIDFIREIMLIAIKLMMVIIIMTAISE